MPRYPHLEAFETSVDKKAAGVALASLERKQK
jgi:hypothetical protein